MARRQRGGTHASDLAHQKLYVKYVTRAQAGTPQTQSDMAAEIIGSAKDPDVSDPSIMYDALAYCNFLVGCLDTMQYKDAMVQFSHTGVLVPDQGVDFGLGYDLMTAIRPLTADRNYVRHCLIFLARRCQDLATAPNLSTVETLHALEIMFRLINTKFFIHTVP
jgi:hypothetical protein